MLQCILESRLEGQYHAVGGESKILILNLGWVSSMLHEREEELTESCGDPH